jgi:hypothetical protein
MFAALKFDQTMTKRHRIKLLTTDPSKAELVLRRPMQVTVVACVSLTVGLALVAVGTLLT